MICFFEVASALRDAFCRYKIVDLQCLYDLFYLNQAQEASLSASEGPDALKYFDFCRSFYRQSLSMKNLLGVRKLLITCGKI